LFDHHLQSFYFKGWFDIELSRERNLNRYIDNQIAWRPSSRFLF